MFQRACFCGGLEMLNVFMFVKKRLAVFCMAITGWQNVMNATALGSPHLPPVCLQQTSCDWFFDQSVIHWTNLIVRHRNWCFKKNQNFPEILLILSGFSIIWSETEENMMYCFVSNSTNHSDRQWNLCLAAGMACFSIILHLETTRQDKVMWRTPSFHKSKAFSLVVVYTASINTINCHLKQQTPWKRSEFLCEPEAVGVTYYSN